jgi:hypothetical protein
MQLSVKQQTILERKRNNQEVQTLPTQRVSGAVVTWGGCVWYRYAFINTRME